MSNILPTLQTFLTATQRLLHDANFKYWSQQTLIDAINGAQKRVVGDSLCNRQNQSIILTQGQELYSYGSVTGVNIVAGGANYNLQPVNVKFSAPPSPAAAVFQGTTATGTAVIGAGGAITGITITNPGSGYTEPPIVFIVNSPGGGTGASATCTALNANTLDTLNITVQWGTERVILNRMPYTKFQASVRSWMGYTQRPGFCASYGQNQWYIGPIPDIQYVSEWDTVLIPPDLVNLTDTSVIQYPYSECVAYYAAHTAKYMEQSYAEADQFLQLYTQKMKYSVRSVMMRMLPSAYNG